MSNTSSGDTAPIRLRAQQRQLREQQARTEQEAQTQPIPAITPLTRYQITRERYPATYRMPRTGAYSLIHTVLARYRREHPGQTVGTLSLSPMQLLCYLKDVAPEMFRLKTLLGDIELEAAPELADDTIICYADTATTMKGKNA